MKIGSLRKIKNSLERVFRTLEKHELYDNAIRHRYAEFLVAYELAKRGHKIELLGGRKEKKADLYLADLKKRVEVKSGRCDEDNWAYASFGKGNQIGKRWFDYCVFVTFARDKERVKNIFIFTIDELFQVAWPRKRVARYQDNNPCILMFAPTFKEFKDWVKQKRIKAWDIETKLCRHPERYKNAWHKIK